MADKQTIKIYDHKISTYKQMVTKLPDLEPLDAFMTRLSPGSRILDWGCGPGYLAARMRDFGMKPVCVDASAKMVAAAQNDYDLDARQEQFSDLDAISVYDGIWANFSLLHAERAVFADHIAAAVAALVPSGLLYIAVKSGEGEKRDGLGRFYVYYMPEELQVIVKQCKLQVVQTFTGRSAGMSGNPENWIGLLCQK